jgi:glucose-1-phosphate cytidylyltransferase
VARRRAEHPHITPVSGARHWMNGGFFVFRREIFDCLNAGEDLVAQPFRRLIDRRQL